MPSVPPRISLQIVEIAEHLEDHEEVAVDAGAEGQPSEDEAALTNLDDVVTPPLRLSRLNRTHATTASDNARTRR